MLKRLFLLIVFIPVIVFGQLNRPNQATNITNNIHNNGTQAITGNILQGVMLNQNSSYQNIISDTLLQDVRNFSSGKTYTPGMGTFYGDTLWKDSITHSGAWNRNHFIPIAFKGQGGSDTGTHKSAASYYQMQKQISDSAKKQPYLKDSTVAYVTPHQLAAHGYGTGTVTSIATGWGTTGGTITTTGTIKADTSKLSTIAGLHDSLKKYPLWQDTSLYLVTYKQQATILGSYVKYSDSTKYFVTFKKLTSDSANALNFLCGIPFMKSWVGTRGYGTNYLGDTVGGAGATPLLATRNFTKHGTDSVGGGDSNSLYLNSYNALIEKDTIYHTTSSGNNVGAGIKVTVSINNIPDDGELYCRFYKPSVKPCVWTFPSNGSHLIYHLCASPWVTISGQKATFPAIAGTDQYTIKIVRTGTQYDIYFLKV